MKGIYLLELDSSATVDEGYANDSIEISMNALIGITSSQTMHLVVGINNFAMHALVDIGSTPLS